MNKEDIIRMAREAGLHAPEGRTYILSPTIHPDDDLSEYLERFAALVVSAEREAISDEWWSCYQADLENGVKSLNEYEVMKFATTYPELAKFGKWIDARGQA